MFFYKVKYYHDHFVYRGDVLDILYSFCVSLVY